MATILVALGGLIGAVVLGALVAPTSRTLPTPPRQGAPAPCHGGDGW
jgi:hypothetical protein